MQRRVTCELLAVISAIVMFLVCQPAVRGHSGVRDLMPQQRPTVYIVALRDASVLTMCPAIPEVRFAGGGGWKPDGRVTSAANPSDDDLQRLFILSGARMQDIVQEPERYGQFTTRHVSLPRPLGPGGGVQGGSGSLVDRVELGGDRAAIDTPVEEALRKEFQRLKRYDVVDSPEKADYVFLADSFYFEAQAVSRNAATLYYSGDLTPNLRQSVLAIVVPGEAYRQAPGDITSLLKHRTWEGSALLMPPISYTWQNPISEVRLAEEHWYYRSAPPQSVVRQLHGKEPRMPSHPVLCAATDRPFQLEPLPTVSQATIPARPDSPPVNDVTGAAGRGQSPTFRARVTYVPVPVVALDAAGERVVDLQPTEFRIYENDVEQKIDRVLSVTQPFSMALLVDTSTSLWSKLAAIQDAALSFIDATRPDDQLMLVSFDRRVFGQSPMTSDRERLHRAVVQMNKRDGTRLYDAVRLAADQPAFSNAERNAMVLLTDGVDTESRLSTDATALAFAAQAGIPIYAVQYVTEDAVQPASVTDMRRGDSRNVSHIQLLKLPVDTYVKAGEVLQKLAASTGGVFYRASTSSSALEALQRVARDLRAQYTVCYYPSNQAQDGSYRQIRVEVGRPGITVRARAGYRAGR